MIQLTKFLWVAKIETISISPDPSFPLNYFVVVNGSRLSSQASDWRTCQEKVHEILDDMEKL